MYYHERTYLQRTTCMGDHTNKTLGIIDSHPLHKKNK